MKIVPYHHITAWLFDVRIWIILLFLIRLENIDLAPYDEHAWRQTMTLGVARNYAEVDDNFLQPRTIICDSRGGIFAQEFPVFNYCVFLLWKVFGAHNWCFRLFNLIVASIGLWAFAQTVRRLVNDRTALLATVIFGVSVAFVYARKGMPDVFAVSLALVGVYWGWRFLEEKKGQYLILFAVFAALGMLCKMPAACVMALLISGVWRNDVEAKIKTQLLGAGAFSVAAMAFWYFSWVPMTEKEYGFPLFYPTTIADGWRQLVEMKTDTLSRFYPIALTSRVAFLFCVVGLALAVWKRNKTILVTFMASAGLLFALMLKAGGTFSGHVYYIIPFVPMMALLAGHGINEVFRKEWLQLAVLVVIVTEATYQHKRDFFIPWEDQKYLKLEQIVDKHIPRESRILVNNREGSPVMLYAAHRRGWTVTDRMKDSAWVAGESTVGMHYLVIERSRWQDTLPFPRLYEDNEFQIYKTKKD
jgi:4-amino-4-deoxy-L-arabinose transferase-like glycosyltransferase